MEKSNVGCGVGPVEDAPPKAYPRTSFAPIHNETNVGDCCTANSITVAFGVDPVILTK